MQSNKIYLTDYIKEIKDLIESHKDVRKVILFGGEVTEDDFKNVQLDPKKATVLLANTGGKLKSGLMKGEIECDTRIAAYICAKTDKETLGYSTQAQTVTQELMTAVNEKYKYATTGTRHLPEFQLMTEITANVRKGFGTWSLVWQQTVNLK
ncbi:hypothetical protein P5E67_00770 [Vibrio parahaemolyticus]|nr:hypothetical protein [Vibrio parahaemolyticus]